MDIYSYELDAKEQMALPENRESMERSMARMKDSLRFYQNSCGEEDALKDPMYGIPDAYGLINALLFDGISSEKARVREGKALHPELLGHMPSLLGAVRNIFYFFTASVMHGESSPRTLYRTERAAGLEMMLKKGRTVSLTSASGKCEFPDYLLEKEGICLLQIQVPAFTPCIDVNAILTEGNRHAEEEEVILPPFLDLEIRPREELFRGKIPVYRVEVKGPEEIEKLSFGDITRKERERLCDRDVLDRCALALRAIESGREPDPGDLEAYLDWKKLFKDAVLTWFEEARKASEICRDAGRLRAGTERQMRRGFMTPEEALRVRTENAGKIRLISGVYVSDLASFTDRVLELSGLEKDYYDYYPADLGHPEYGPGSSPAFIYFKDLPDLSGEGPGAGEKICFSVKTVNGSAPAWMQVEMTVREKEGELIRGETRIPGYTGRGEFFAGEPGKEFFIISNLWEDREDPVWETKRKEPERRFRLRLKEQDPFRESDGSVI